MFIALCVQYSCLCSLFAYNFLIFQVLPPVFVLVGLGFFEPAHPCVISVKFLLKAKLAAVTSATWSLGEVGLLKQCLVQRYYAETADGMGPTGRSN